jgi:hypothetical protein
MKNHRKIIPAAVMLAAFASVPSATASSLLSGYGGPGQGSQAILGSALLNTPRGGGPASGSTGSLAAEAQALTVPSSGAPAARSGRSSRGAAAGTARRTPGSARAAGSTGTSGTASPAYIVSRRAAAAAPFMGLSTEDLLGVIAVSCALILVGLLTRLLARTGADRGLPKGIVQKNRANG